MRRDVDTVLEPTRQLIQQSWVALLIAAGVCVAGLVSLALWLAAPLSRVTAFARALAAGEAHTAPHEETRYSEVSSLSIALVRLQAQLALRQETSREKPVTLERAKELRSA